MRCPWPRWAWRTTSPAPSSCPYTKFHAASEALKYDVELLGLRFEVGFETVCHRLSTLQRPGQRGVPFIFVRTDRAGTSPSVSPPRPSTSPGSAAAARYGWCTTRLRLGPHRDAGVVDARRTVPLLAGPHHRRTDAGLPGDAQRFRHRPRLRSVPRRSAGVLPPASTCTIRDAWCRSGRDARCATGPPAAARLPQLGRPSSSTTTSPSRRPTGPPPPTEPKTRRPSPNPADRARSWARSATRPAPSSCRSSGGQLVRQVEQIQGTGNRLGHHVVDARRTVVERRDRRHDDRATAVGACHQVDMSRMQGVCGAAGRPGAALWGQTSAARTTRPSL